MRFFAVVAVLFGGGLVASAGEFYVLQGIDKTHPDDVVAAPGLDGFTIRVSWRKLHEEGFSWLDEQIARGDALGVDMQLRVMAGAHAPLDLPGVAYFTYLDSDASGVAVVDTAPVPWDDAMHRHWRTLASELAERYGDNSQIRVAHVPGFANSSEMHTPAELILVPGYSSRALAESWAALAEPLAAAFPEAIISLNYATPTQAQISGSDADWLLEELAAVAGERAGYQANDFDAEITLDRNKYQTLLEQQELGRRIGFQMVSSSLSSRFGGEFLDAVATASEAGAEWLEIYAADIVNLPPTGDYNLDGAVDAADFTRWRDTMGQTGPALAADGNGNGQIDSGDYGVWKTHFGHAAAGSTATLSVPEGSTSVLLVISGFVFGWRWRRQVGGLGKARAPYRQPTFTCRHNRHGRASVLIVSTGRFSLRRCGKLPPAAGFSTDQAGYSPNFDKGTNRSTEEPAILVCSASYLRCERHWGSSGAANAD